jgi:hypothetical protein
MHFCDRSNAIPFNPSTHGQATMLNMTKIVLSAGILLGAATATFAAKDDSPADTRGGPYFYADTYGVPASPLQLHQPDRSPHEHPKAHDLHDR